MWIETQLLPQTLGDRHHESKELILTRIFDDERLHRKEWIPIPHNDLFIIPLCMCAKTAALHCVFNPFVWYNLNTFHNKRTKFEVFSLLAWILMLHDTVCRCRVSNAGSKPSQGNDCIAASSRCFPIGLLRSSLMLELWTTPTRYV